MRRTQHNRRSRTELSVLALLLVAIALVLDWAGWTWRLDNLVYDELLKLAAQPKADNIVIVAIDERSLAALGRWPWPRRLHAEVIQALDKAGAKAVGLNIILAEADFQDPEGDDLLAASKRQYGRVVLPLLPEATATAGVLREALPMPVLAASAAGIGHVDLEIEPDGIVRYVFLRGGLGEARWPHFAVALQQVAATGTTNKSVAVPSQGQGVWVRSQRVSIPFARTPGRFTRYAYIDVLRGDIGAKQLRDCLVLIGATAAGLGHPLPTPLSGEQQGMPGVEVIANILAAAQGASDFVRQLPAPWQMLISATIAVLPALQFPLLPASRVLPVAIGLLALP